MKETILKPRKCAECGTLFVPRSVLSSNAFYCCKACQKAAANRRAKERVREGLREALASLVPDAQNYISVAEAVAIFQVSRTALYLKIETNKIPVVRISKNKIRLKRSDLAALYPTRKEQKNAEPLKPKAKLYRLEPEDCYTIGEINEKFHMGDTTIYTNIRKYHIPMRQIGRFVYVPKSEIDELFKS